MLAEDVDLFTVAHEAAHVVQQRGGVRLEQGIGRTGDANEQHADEVAARVVSGRSAEHLLNQRNSPDGAESVRAMPDAPVQRLVIVKDQDPPRKFVGMPIDGMSSKRITKHRPDTPLSPRKAKRAAQNKLMKSRPMAKATRATPKRQPDDKNSWQLGRGTACYALVNEVNEKIKELGLEADDEATKEVQSLVNQNNIYRFNSIEDIVNRLATHGHLTRKAKGAYLGPRRLGPRPVFAGDAASLEGGDGKHRRHVISSSTLGRAIERSNAPLTLVNQFLQRHDGEQVTGTRTLDEQIAKRRAWVIVHNHCGNLWIGDGAANVAIGFIRSPLTAMSDQLRGRKELTIAHDDPDLQMPSAPIAKTQPLRERHWKYVSHVLTMLLKEATNEGRINREEAISISDEVIANCDLDLPPSRNTEYFETVHKIYLDLVDRPGIVFKRNGALDQFMKLDHNDYPTVPDSARGASTSGE